MTDEHTDACRPDNCDISGDEYVARLAKDRLAELSFPPRPIAPPVRSRIGQSLRFFVLFYLTIGLLALALAPLVRRWLVAP